MNKQEDVLKRIAGYLMLHGSFTGNIGLLHGKMGFVLFFMNYARYTGNKRYGKFAEELINEIYAEISVDCSLNFEDGLPGIAWGMEYLIRNRFVKANPDEVLEDIDLRVFERDVRWTVDYSLEKGLKGLAYYAISRCTGRDYQPAFKEYLSNLASRLKDNATVDEESSLLVESLEALINRTGKQNDIDFLATYISGVNYGKQVLFNGKRGLGLGGNGYAAIGLKIMWEEQKC